MKLSHFQERLCEGNGQKKEQEMKFAYKGGARRDKERNKRRIEVVYI